jgi:hypothetical protein
MRYWKDRDERVGVGSIQDAGTIQKQSRKGGPLLLEVVGVRIQDADNLGQTTEPKSSSRDYKVWIGTKIG